MKASYFASIFLSAPGKSSSSYNSASPSLLKKVISGVILSSVFALTVQNSFGMDGTDKELNQRVPQQKNVSTVRREHTKNKEIKNQFSFVNICAYGAATALAVTAYYLMPKNFGITSTGGMSEETMEKVYQSLLQYQQFHEATKGIRDIVRAESHDNTYHSLQERETDHYKLNSDALDKWNSKCVTSFYFTSGNTEKGGTGQFASCPGVPASSSWDFGPEEMRYWDTAKSVKLYKLFDGMLALEAGIENDNNQHIWEKLRKEQNSWW